MKCRARSKVFKDQLTSGQRRAMLKECEKEHDEFLHLYARQASIQVYYILRFKLGFGKKRLKRFSKWLSETPINTMEKYLATDEEALDILEVKLRESGINVDELLKESED